MRLFVQILTVLVFFVTVAHGNEPTPVMLQTHLQPPYQVMDSSVLRGRTPQMVQCVFDQLNRPYVIAIAPRKRNRELVKQNRIDGFFLSIPDIDLDETSIPTEPLALERWKVFRLKETQGSGELSLDQIGAVLGANEEIWLKRHGPNLHATIPNVKSLAKLLATGRISAALADEEVFLNASRAIGLNEDDLESTFVRYVPLVAYFSKMFIKNNPDFISQFNKALATCARDFRDATQMERQQLLKRAQSILAQYENNIGTVEKTQRGWHIRKKKLHQADADWKEAIARGRQTSLMSDILANKGSAFLRTLVESSQGINEIFLTDKEGYNIAMNVPTSDYWQGDEDAFMALSSGQISYISQILFDHSTHAFQVQVSLPIRNQKSSQLDGMLTVGFDVDKIFSKIDFLSNP
ncbi:hypothetical protein GCM10011332_13000 [Terasakiella brassicae]|uniref:Solute-binding protein family 3/N-terminal domain-containing protein n=1 Tax=Terasakiella brassicae TaxID=1634917 RepID=A0A917BVT2_9PROT|nr:hypothetical protein [Terasakiella brassicae]GGF60630.1 hypothetical protein GCM10011332_13000 [Terasakiella brassicae]